MSRAVRRVRRGIRWVLLGKGPLKRGSDRIEMLSRLLLLAALLAAVPAAFLISGQVHRHLEGVAAAQAAQRHATPAVLVRDAGSAADRSSTDTAIPLVSTPVRWTTPQGAARTAEVPVPVTARAGSTVRIWLRTDGSLVGAPLDQNTISSDVACAGILSAAGIPVLAWGLHGTVRAVLGRRRSRQWAEEWQAVEPVWAARR